MKRDELIIIPTIENILFLDFWKIPAIPKPNLDQQKKMDVLINILDSKFAPVIIKKNKIIGHKQETIPNLE